MYLIEFKFPIISQIVEKKDTNLIPFQQIVLTERSERVVNIDGVDVKTTVPSANLKRFSMIHRPVSYLDLFNIAPEFPDFNGEKVNYKGLYQYLKDNNLLAKYTKPSNYEVGATLFGTVVKMTVVPYIISNQTGAVSTNSFRAFLPVIEEAQIKAALEQAAKDGSKIYSPTSTEFLTQTVAEFAMKD